jgi:glycosyltransferase involved in cell wall biosynthesis
MRRSASEKPAGAAVLYLSYDGMTDPLGRSQVLPYLLGLSKRGHRISLISFEKPERTAEERKTVADLCTGSGIDWHPLPYHHSPPVLSTVADVRRMYRLALRLHREHRFDLVHCRSYIPALAGLWLKRRTGICFLFDMRGFWADERLEGGGWDMSNPFFAGVYRYFKRREREFWAEADQIVSLTHEGAQVLEEARRQGNKVAPVTVVPCCVEFDVFPPANAERRDQARALLGINADEHVLGYIGSLGGNYMLDEMLEFFAAYRERYRSAKFLFVTQVPPEQIRCAAHARRIPVDAILVRAAGRAEVAMIMAAADTGIAFKQPSFSARACSPTKLGEMLAMELPVMVNEGVGDVPRVVEETGSGVVIDRFDRRSYEQALDSLESLRPNMDRWRTGSRKWFDLEQCVDRYDAIYRSCLSRA